MPSSNRVMVREREDKEACHMDAARRDLHCYHLARLLHLVPHLHRVYTENCFLVPLFFSCVSPLTKARAKLILLCLNRRFGSYCTQDVWVYILSFLSFPELAASAPPHSPSRREDPLWRLGFGQKAVSPSSKKRPREEGGTMVSPDSSLSVTNRLVKTDDSAANTEKWNERPMESSPPLLSPPPPPPKQQHEEIRVVTGGEGSMAEEVKRIFLVRPPLLPVDSPMTSATSYLFVRMTSEYQLNEETMNTYFGRYGQVSCTLLRQQKIQDGSSLCGTNHVQDFIVSVDSMHNALQAVRHAYYRELTFIALCDSAHNKYTFADLDQLLHNIVVEVVKGEEEEEEAVAPALQSFVPDVVLDGLPYWLTIDQLRATFSEYGRVQDVRIAVDDRSGAFTGAALLRMSSVEEAVAASEALNGATLKGHVLVSGVLDDRLNIVSLRNGAIIRKADEVVPEDCDLSENGRRWV